MKQLYCEDLKGGDIMLKYVQDFNPINIPIKMIQKAMGFRNPRITHAGIMKDSIYVVEPGPLGIEKNSLAHKSFLKSVFTANSHLGYIVYRSTNVSMAKGAGTAAQLLFDIHKKHKSMRYAYVKVWGSILPENILTKLSIPTHPKFAEHFEKIYEKIIGGGSYTMICSQFVVFVYQWVAIQLGIPPQKIFNINDAITSPAKLAELLQDNPYFFEAGYMIGGEHERH